MELAEAALLKDFYEYDPATNTWTQKADFGGTGRYYAAGFSIGSKGYIGTGGLVLLFKDFWEYTPATAQTPGTWTATGSMNVARAILYGDFATQRKGSCCRRCTRPYVLCQTASPARSCTTQHRHMDAHSSMTTPRVSSYCDSAAQWEVLVAAVKIT